MTASLQETWNVSKGGIHPLLQITKLKFRCCNSVVIHRHCQPPCEDAKNLPKTQFLSPNFSKSNREAPCQQLSQHKLQKPTLKVWKFPGSRAKCDCAQVITNLFWPKERCQGSLRAGKEVRAPTASAAAVLHCLFP